MTEVSTRPHVGATKTPARHKAAPFTAPEPTGQAAATSTAITDDEKTVAAAAAEQLQGIYDAHWKDLDGNSSGLLLMAIRELGAIQEKREEDARGDLFHNAAAATRGAWAIQHAERPGGVVIGHLESAIELIESADISYGFLQGPCADLATGIRAGTRTPPIARMGDAGYSAAQLRAVLEFVAGTANTLNNILMTAQTSEEVWERACLVDAAQLIALQIGAAADEGAGGTVIGNSARWNYGPNFSSKAGAA